MVGNFGLGVCFRSDDRLAAAVVVALLLLLLFALFLKGGWHLRERVLWRGAPPLGLYWLTLNQKQSWARMIWPTGTYHVHTTTPAYIHIYHTSFFWSLVFKSRLYTYKKFFVLPILPKLEQFYEYSVNVVGILAHEAELSINTGFIYIKCFCFNDYGWLNLLHAEQLIWATH